MIFIKSFCDLDDYWISYSSVYVLNKKEREIKSSQIEHLGQVSLLNSET